MVKTSLNWIQKNRTEAFFLFAIILIALFFRLYRIDEYMTFLGDEGRDALVVKKILVEGDFPLLGPPTSVGNMYLGPLYYYMMALSMAVVWMNPVAAAVMVAVLATATVGLIYYLARAWFSKASAIIASLLYAVSPVNITYSRSSWNPNPAPFFTLLAFLGFYKAHRTGNFWWLVLTGIALAFVIQMHYLALILIPVFGLLWLYELSLKLRKKLQRKNFIKGTLISITAFLILMSPLAIFDFKYDFMNFNAVKTFFTNRETTVNLNALNTTDRILPIYTDNLIGRYMTGENFWLSSIVAVLVLMPLVFVIYQKKKGVALRWPYLALYLWLGVGVLGLALYKQTIYDHYLGFINPLPYLLLGAAVFIVGKIKNPKIENIATSLVLFLILSLVVVNLQSSPLLKEPNRQLQKTQDISKFIIEEAGGKPFNFALIAKHNYDAAYQFYLDQMGYNPKKVPDEITDQLFIVCEDEECNPVGHPKYEIAAFGWSKVEYEKEFAGIRVFKLTHNDQQSAN